MARYHKLSQGEASLALRQRDKPVAGVAAWTTFMVAMVLIGVLWEDAAPKIAGLLRVW